jgi:hypothetical protein
MSESKAADSARRANGVSADRERRQHHHLRDLIDEMMASLRAASNRDLFTVDDRAQAEVQLSLIMARVHAEAMHVADRKKS